MLHYVPLRRYTFVHCSSHTCTFSQLCPFWPMTVRQLGLLPIVCNFPASHLTPCFFFPFLVSHPPLFRLDLRLIPFRSSSQSIVLRYRDQTVVPLHISATTTFTNTNHQKPSIEHQRHGPTFEHFSYFVRRRAAHLYRPLASLRACICILPTQRSAWWHLHPRVKAPEHLLPNRLRYTSESSRLRSSRSTSGLHQAASHRASGT